MNIVTGERPIRQACAHCGGELVFSPEKMALACQSCGSIFAIDGDPHPAEETALEYSQRAVQTHWGIHTKQLTCTSCGAQRVENELQLAGKCPYCGSHYVLESSAEDLLPPDGVVPFSVSREQAQQKLRLWLGQKPLAPAGLRKKDFTQKFTGSYIPCWTFDAQTTTRYRGRYSIRHGGKIYWSACTGTYSAFVNDVLTDAGKSRGKEQNRLIQEIQPFATEENLQYDARYLLGFSAQRYQRGLADSWLRAKNMLSRELARRTEQHVKDKYGASVVQIDAVTVYQNVTYKYLLLPVWMLAFPYMGSMYLIAVNGQTGKISGRTPAAAEKVGIIAAVVLLVILLLFLL